MLTIKKTMTMATMTTTTKTTTTIHNHHSIKKDEMLIKKMYIIIVKYKLKITHVMYVFSYNLVLVLSLACPHLYETYHAVVRASGNVDIHSFDLNLEFAPMNMNMSTTAHIIAHIINECTH